MRLSEYLKAHGLTPEQFGDRLGVNRTTIVRYLNGTRRPDLDRLEAISLVTGGEVQPSDFFREPQAATGGSLDSRA